MTAILEARVSVFAHVRATIPTGNPSLAEVLAQIKDGSSARRIAELREARGHLSEEAYKAKKAKLRCFTPCCTLRTRDRHVAVNDKLTSVTGMVHLDFDHLADLHATREHLLKEPSLVFVFTSPSGDGLKAGLAATGIVDRDTYKHAWRQVVETMEARYPGIKASRDPSISYINALCYVSHDPDLYTNAQAVPIEVVPYDRPPEVPKPEQETEPREGPSFAVVASALASIPNDDVHYDTWFKIGAALHSTRQPWARGLFDGWSQQSAKFDPTEQHATWGRLNPTKNIRIDTLFGMARKAGWQDPNEGEGTNRVLSAQKVGSAAPHEIRPKTDTALIALTAYPWPTLAPETLSGLAGDYVRTIAPHTESDRVALLTQFLTVCGVLIGRERYIILDGVRHYTNLFMVLAGLTSRARKGTAYAHVETQIHAVDPRWGLANHIKGCGSGEGLIYAVRDPVYKLERVKDKGEPARSEMVEVDPGVEDKRALYQTGEFSGLLKVAAREGNTLSEVLRDAWDTGYLRNATKAHPLQAHNAHIGVIGHITIDELQKLFTSTDMANGFGNRFLWVCARRSKLLPRGGNLSQVNFTRLRERLTSAVAFGETAGEMQFDEPAGVVWDAVYGMLAEDRVGLANTLLARAEPQVARLAMLYAILDQSPTIGVEHLNAALALWEYTEDSAAYIFGEALGDDTADTIVKALEKAGSAGLSQSTLREDVFQKNVPAAEIRRALHLLEKLDRIVTTIRQPEGGIGRPSTRYTLQQYAVNAINAVNRGRYLVASNDAVKKARLFADESPENDAVSPQNGVDPHLEPLFVPDMTGATPDSAPPEVPDNGNNMPTAVPLREPGDDDDFEEGDI